MKNLCQLSELTWPKAEEALVAADFCVLPCGALEQHGFHLPLDTDSLIAARLLALVTERLNGQISLLSLPILSYGHSPEHLGFPGTVSLPKEILSGLVTAVARSLARHGTKRLLLLNTHGGNEAVLHSILRNIRDETSLVPYLFNLYESVTVRRHSAELDLHAGEVETSLMLYLEPQKVREGSCLPHQERSGLGISDLRLHMPWRAEEFSPTGVIGDPQSADAQRGQAILEEVSAELAELLITITKQGEDR